MKGRILIIISILLLGCGLRFYGITWGAPYFLHNDEGWTVFKAMDLIDRFNRGSLNPEFSSYGALPLYLLPLVRTVVFYITSPNFIFNDPRVYTYIIARSVSAFLGILTILLTYLLGRRLYGSLTGVLSGLFVALTVVLVRECHFYTPDTMLLFFIMVVMYFAARMMESGKVRDYLFAGIFAAMAISVKSISLLLIFPIFAAHLLGLKDGSKKTGFCLIKRIVDRRILYSLSMMVLVSLALNPYAVLDYQNYFQDKDNLHLLGTARLVLGVEKAPFTLQFEGTLPYIYHIRNLLFFGMGLPLEVLSLIGLVFGLYRHKREDILLLSWIVPYFMVVGAWYVKYIRYIIPLIPFLAIFGARWLVKLQDVRNRWARITSLSIAGLTIVFSLFYSLAYVNIYSAQDTRIAASRWVFDNVEQGKRILLEKDEGFLPYPLFKEGVRYNIEIFDIFYPRLSNIEKLKYIENRLSQADYLLLSQTNYERYLRLSRLYPVESRYYELLLKERLGFRLVKEFKTYPNLFGVSINDDSSELTFRLFDHPKISIFKRVGKSIPEFQAQEK